MLRAIYGAQIAHGHFGRALCKRHVHEELIGRALVNHGARVAKHVFADLTDKPCQTLLCVQELALNQQISAEAGGDLLTVNIKRDDSVAVEQVEVASHPTGLPRLNVHVAIAFD